jgi:hypothetical protein
MGQFTLEWKWRVLNLDCEDVNGTQRVLRFVTSLFLMSTVRKIGFGKLSDRWLTLQEGPDPNDAGISVAQLGGIV